MRIVLTPDWFLRGDVSIEIFSFIVLFAFFIFSMRSYRISKNKNTKTLGKAFLLIAVAELSNILTKLVLFYDTTFTQNIGNMAVTYHIVKSTDIFYNAGFFFYKLLTLIGLYTIYQVSLKKKSLPNFVLVFYFLMISAFASNFFYFIFHITALIFLILVIQNYNKIYKKNKLASTKILIIAFSFIALAQLVFILSKIGVFYITAEFIELIGYIILLALMIRILQYGGKKTKSK
jgi:hypothetical protein